VLIKHLFELNKNKRFFIEQGKKYTSYEDLFYCPKPIIKFMKKKTISNLLQENNAKYWSQLKKMKWIILFYTKRITYKYYIQTEEYFYVYQKFINLMNEYDKDLIRTVLNYILYFLFKHDYEEWDFIFSGAFIYKLLKEIQRNFKSVVEDLYKKTPKDQQIYKSDIRILQMLLSDDDDDDDDK